LLSLIFFSYDDLLSFLKLPIVSEDNPWQAELNYSTINSSATFFLWMKIVSKFCLVFRGPNDKITMVAGVEIIFF